MSNTYVEYVFFFEVIRLINVSNTYVEYVFFFEVICLIQKSNSYVEYVFFFEVRRSRIRLRQRSRPWTRFHVLGLYAFNLEYTFTYAVATISRPLKIIRLFCRISSLL